jgi:uncharacterized protein YggE
MTASLLSALVAITVAAQAPGSEVAEPVIVTSATGEVTVRPDRAVILIGVETTDSAAAKAARETASKLRALIDTLVALGTPRDSLPTTGYSVGPDWRAREGERRYKATATVRLSLSDLGRIPEILEAALAAGANNIPYVRVQAENTDAARESAIRQAVEKARKDAEALARAAGGRLGRLLELKMAPGFRYPVVEPMSEMAAAPRLSFTPRGVTVRATVTGKWEYLAPGS